MCVCRGDGDDRDDVCPQQKRQACSVEKRGAELELEFKELRQELRVS